MEIRLKNVKIPNKDFRIIFQFEIVIYALYNI